MGTKRVYTDIGSPDAERAAFRPTPQMLAEAWHRNTAPRSLTSWVMGDPPPGASALDRRKSPIVRDRIIGRWNPETDTIR